MKEYNVKQYGITLYYDNMNAINISKNRVHITHTKYINIHHHLIREMVEDKVITLDHVATENQLVDIFNKDLDASQFEKLRNASS